LKQMTNLPFLAGAGTRLQPIMNPSRRKRPGWSSLLWPLSQALVAAVNEFRS
jgi:hypothetical protein